MEEVFMSDPVPVAPAGRPFIFYAPHQDDETLWAGQVIAHHALAGREVHIVSATDGSTSTIRDSLNGLKDNGWWGNFHHPAREQIPALDPAAFAQARDRELLNAAPQLGVPVGNVHLDLGTRKSTISITEAKQLIRDYDDQYPDAGHYTTWWGDPDPNHAALGTALRQLALEDPVKFVDCRWVVRRSQHATAPGASAYTIPAGMAAQAVHMSKCAARAYSAWGPLQNLFAIGYHSVPADFAAVENGDANWIVKTP